MKFGPGGWVNVYYLGSAVLLNLPFVRPVIPPNIFAYPESETKACQISSTAAFDQAFARLLDNLIVPGALTHRNTAKRFLTAQLLLDAAKRHTKQAPNGKRVEACHLTILGSASDVMWCLAHMLIVNCQISSLGTFFGCSSNLACQVFGSRGIE